MTFTTLLFIITLGALAIIGIALVWLKERINHLKEKIGGGNQQPTKRPRKGVRK